MGIEQKLRYRKWIQESEDWQACRKLAMLTVGNTCIGCGLISESNHAHHICYPAKWEQTLIWHLRILCAQCHARIHELTDPGSYGSHPGAIRWALKGFDKALLVLHSERGLSEDEKKRLNSVGKKARSRLAIHARKQRKWLPQKIIRPNKIKRVFQSKEERKQFFIKLYGKAA